jgi:SAM-dependent methyltransferase
MVRCGIKYIKLPSQLYTSKLVKFLYNKKLRRELKIVLSTGMHTLDQVFKNSNYNYADIIFYCRSIYPCVLNEVNFKGFIEMKSKINNVDNNINVGYSSHDVRGEAIPHMVLLGAKHIERHYTLDTKMKGSDHKTVSSDYEEMETIIKGIKEAENMLAHYDLNGDLLEKEQAVRKRFVEEFNMNEKWYKKIRDSQNCKAYVGPEKLYDIFGELQVRLLVNMGLNDTHSILDVGCGCLRAGIHLIPITKKYVGVEPEKWVVEQGLKNCIATYGQELIDKKAPVIYSKVEEVKDKFDFIMLHSIFSHAPVNMIKNYLEKLKYMLNPKGKIILTYAPGKQNHKGKKWVYPGLVQYKKEFMFDLFKKYGYKIKNMEWPHTTQKWVVLERWVIIENNVEVKNA